MLKQEHIPIFCAINDAFSPFSTTMIASIMENTHSFVDFYIMEDNISFKNKQKIKRMEKIYSHCKVDFIKIPKDYTVGFPDIRPYSLATYWRYFIPKMNDGLHKVIYTDVDVIFCGDIKQMYNENMDGFGLAAVPGDIGIPIKGIYRADLRKKNLGISEDHIFFQAGNLIIDCDYWRRNNIVDRLKEITICKKKDLLCPDMDVLNIVFDKNYKKLHCRYSVCTHRFNKMETTPQLLEAYSKPFCIHYASRRKPWQSVGVPYEEYFWYYASKSPFLIDIINFFLKNVPLKGEEKIRFFLKMYWKKLFFKNNLSLWGLNRHYECKKKNILNRVQKFYHNKIDF